MTKYEYKTARFVRQEEIDDEAEAGWHIKQVGDYVNLGLRWEKDTDMAFEWVLFERKVTTDAAK